MKVFKYMLSILLLASLCQAQNSFRSHRYKMLSLNDGISFWRLEEASGTRTDELSTNDLSENTTIVSGTGRIGNGTDFEAGETEILSRADNAALSTGDIDFTIAAWSSLESKPGSDMRVVSKGSTDQWEWGLRWDTSSDDYFMLLRDNLTSSIAAQVLAGITPTTGVFDFIVAGHDATANEGFIQANNGTLVTGSVTGAVADGTSDFRISSLGGTSQYFDGIIDAVFFTKRLLTDFEKRMLYNWGHGMEYYSELGSWDHRK